MGTLYTAETAIPANSADISETCSQDENGSRWNFGLTPSARRPKPTPNPPAAPPRPKPTATRPSAKSSPSAVADTLLAQVRAEHARTAAVTVDAGTVIVLSSAVIATAAEVAGLKPQSIRRVLMSRPGCTATADMGITVTLP